MRDHVCLGALAQTGVRYSGLVRNDSGGDLDKAGGWYLHCHHLYLMTAGMMTVLNVA